MLTLAEVYVGMQNKISGVLIDEFRKSSWLLDNLIFDDTAILPEGGSSWKYSYKRITKQATAQVRAYGQEFTASEAGQTEYDVQLKILGGAFEVDRAYANTSGSASNVALQFQQKRKAVTALFNELIINGDSGVNPDHFDGLNAIVTGSATEYVPATPIDLSNTAALSASADRFNFEINEWLSSLDSTDGLVFFTNTQMASKIRGVAVKLAQFSQTVEDIENGRQRTINRFLNIPIVDMGERNGSSLPVIPTTGGITDIFAVRLGVDGFHGVMPDSTEDFIRAYMPNMDAPGVKKTGELEIITTVALKATKAAGVFRNVKVQ